MSRKFAGTILVAATTFLVAIGMAMPTATAASQVVAGDQQPVAMTRAEARDAYRAALCPTDVAIDAAVAAEARADVTWTDLQPLVLAMGASQIRAGHELLTTELPWPADVAALIPVYSELLQVSGGSNIVLAEAASLEEYRSLLTSLQNPLPTAIQRLLTRTMKAKKQIKHLLGITRSANCAG